MAWRACDGAVPKVIYKVSGRVRKRESVTTTTTTDLVAHVEDVLELLAHAVVLGGEEGSVEHCERGSRMVNSASKKSLRQDAKMCWQIEKQKTCL